LGLEEALRRLRYVARYPLPGSEVRSEDHNSIVDALKALSAECRAWLPGDPLVDRLDAAIARIRYLRTGDIYEAEDHNYIVDALKVARDVMAAIEAKVAPPPFLVMEAAFVAAPPPPPPTPPNWVAEGGLILSRLGFATSFVAGPPRPPPTPPNNAISMGGLGSRGPEAVLYAEVAHYAG
jgi:hypothetical protein